MDSEVRAGVAIFPEEQVFFEPNRALLKHRKQTQAKRKGRWEESEGAEVTEGGVPPRLGARLRRLCFLGSSALQVYSESVC